ncbi:MAG: hypothetical protein QNK19_15490 [Xanthomonadales bacterium]|nr:hypothetical protein [Xanthomonadales bacterium]
MIFLQIDGASKDIDGDFFVGVTTFHAKGSSDLDEPAFVIVEVRGFQKYVIDGVDLRAGIDERVPRHTSVYPGTLL